MDLPAQKKFSRRPGIPGTRRNRLALSSGKTPERNNYRTYSSTVSGMTRRPERT